MTTKLFSDILPGDHFLATEGMQNIGISTIKQGDLCICTKVASHHDALLFQVPHHPDVRLQGWKSWVLARMLAPTVEIVVGGMQ